MKLMMRGLLGLLLLGAVPVQVEARTDARAPVQAGKPAASRAAVASPARNAVSAPARSAANASARSAVTVASRNSAARPTTQTAGRSATAARQPGSRVVAGRHAATSQRGRQMAAIPYGRNVAPAAIGLRQNAMASCTTRNGRRVCTSGARSVAFRWGGDLAPASMEQSSCPDGTIATLATGHNNVVRCVPL